MKIFDSLHNKFTRQEKSKYLLIVATISLISIGLLFVYSASYYTAQNNTGNKFFYFTKQSIGAIVGFVCMFFCSKLSKKFLNKMAIPLAIVSAVLLVLVLIPGIGVENYGARRWIGIGSFTFQPSEIAKFALVLFVAFFVCRPTYDAKKFKNLLPILAVGGVYCALIILEPNMSITVCVGLVLVVLLLMAGTKIKHFVLILLPLVGAIPLLIFAEPYRIQRLLAFLDPWANPKDEGYQLIQSLYALGSGGWFGVGLFNSRQKYSFLPFAESDFIFSVIGEEWGILGCLIVLSLYLVIIVCGIKIAVNSKDFFDTMLAGGITAVIGVQSAINFCVVTGLIPPTGLPLPFVSYGGTSLVVFSSAIGLLIGVASRNRTFNLSINTNNIFAYINI